MPWGRIRRSGSGADDSLSKVRAKGAGWAGSGIKIAGGAAEETKDGKTNGDRERVAEL